MILANKKKRGNGEGGSAPQEHVAESVLPTHVSDDADDDDDADSSVAFPCTSQRLTACLRSTQPARPPPPPPHRHRQEGGFVIMMLMMTRTRKLLMKRRRRPQESRLSPLRHSPTLAAAAAAALKLQLEGQLPLHPHPPPLREGELESDETGPAAPQRRNLFT